MVYQITEGKGEADADEIEEDGIETHLPIVGVCPLSVEAGKPDPYIYTHDQHASSQ